MTTDLWMLVATGVLALAMTLVYVPGRLLSPGGFGWAMGNRQPPAPPVAAWVERAMRAQQNLTENLGPFAIFVLVAHMAGHSNATTALGAEIFFGARVAHFVVYTLGIPYLRTLLWALSWVGGLMVLSQLLVTT